MMNTPIRQSLWFRGLTAAAVSVAVVAAAAAQPAGTSSSVSDGRTRSKEFGFRDRITVISATSFFPSCSPDPVCDWHYVSPSFGRYVPYGTISTNDYYAAVDIPAGAIVDSIGINNASVEAGVLTASLLQRDRYGNVVTLGSVASTVHNWNTDYSPPLTVLVPDHVDKELVVRVEQAPSEELQYFSWVEVQWHRTLRPPPQTPTFADVPTNHPFFQFIEALKASGVTGGCGNGTIYCPDAPLTRGQMAVFLSKALGLHWPD